MTAFGKTTYGHDFIGSFLQKGETQYGVKGNGKYTNANLEIKEFDLANNKDYMGNNYGSFNIEEKEGQLNFVLKIDCLGKSVAELLETILHEFALHGYDFETICNIYNSQGFNAANKYFNKSSSKTEHNDLKKEESQKGGGKYKKAKKEILNNNPEYKKVFDDREKNMVE